MLAVASEIHLLSVEAVVSWMLAGSVGLAQHLAVVEAAHSVLLLLQTIVFESVRAVVAECKAWARASLLQHQVLREDKLAIHSAR